MGDEWDSFLVGLIDTFKDNTPKQLTEMNAAFAAQDPDSLKRIAHTIKSSASTIGADKMTRICVEIENMVKADDIAGSRVLIVQLERVLPIVFEELEDLRPEV
jgi:HPt (histidine-containing phosphotransfer) domain-containing protein